MIRPATANRNDGLVWSLWWLFLAGLWTKITVTNSARLGWCGDPVTDTNAVMWGLGPPAVFLSLSAAFGGLWLLHGRSWRLQLTAFLTVFSGCLALLGWNLDIQGVLHWICLGSIP